MTNRFRRLTLCLVLILTALALYRPPVRRAGAKSKTPALQVRPAVDWRVYDRNHPLYPVATRGRA